MPELSVSNSFSTLVVLLAAMFAALLSFLSYRFTIPPVPRRIRLLLAAIRAIALFLLFFLIGEPLLSFLNRTTEPPQTLVLVDNSRSMTIADKSGVRSEQLRSVLSSDALASLADPGEARYALFDSRFRLLSSFTFDSLALSGDATNLSQALRGAKAEARKHNIRTIVIISDGNATSGPSPLFEADEIQLPVFSIGIGDTTEPRDIVIRSVMTNTLTYAGTRVPVNVVLKSSGYGGERVEVTLHDSSTVLDRQFVALRQGTREYPLTLHFIPGRPGISRFAVRVSALPLELTDENNRSTFFTKVLKSKMKVLLVGSPGADFAFLRRALEDDPNLEVTSFVEQEDGTMKPWDLDGNSLRNHDCLVLVGIPRPATRTATLQTIAAFGRNGMPCFFFASRELDVSRLGTLDPILPVTFGEGSANEVQAFLQIPDRQATHVILRLPTEGQAPWSSLPPVFQQQWNIRLKPGAQVLGFARIQNMTTTIPLLVVRDLNKQKSVAVCAYGVWRWKMLSDGSLKNFLDAFISNGIRWLTTRDDDRKIRVNPAREFFSNQDPVEFVAQAYDDSYQPVDDARITVSITVNHQDREISLTSLGNGQYAGEFENPGEGDYTYRSSVQRRGSSLGAETGSFSVGNLALEFLETRANHLLLRQLADRTGGTYLDPEDIGQLSELIRSMTTYLPKEIVRSAEIEIWNTQWVLLFIILLFSTEWLVRKRFAMV